MLGRHHSDETIAKLRKAKIGKKFTEEHIKNLSIAHKGKPSNRCGIHLTYEQRKAQSYRLAGKKKPPRTPEHCKHISSSKKLWWAERKKGGLSDGTV